MRFPALLVCLFLVAGCKSDPRDLEARLQTALAVSDGPAALESVDELLRGAPENVDYLTQRGRALELLGRTEEAVGSYRTALGFAPGRSDIMLQRGLALLRLDHAPKAAQDLRATVDLEPENTYARGFLAVALVRTSRNADLVEAERVATSMLERDARNLGALIALSYLRQKQGMLSEARALAGRAHQEDPEEPLVGKLVAAVGLPH